MKLHEEERMKIQPLCGLFGISRQAYYQRHEGREEEQEEVMRRIVIDYVHLLASSLGWAAIPFTVSCARTA